jgi:thioredoxin 1
MGVHNLAEYVAYHQRKLREQNQSQPTPSSTAPPTKKKNYGVNLLPSKSSFDTSVIQASAGRLVLLDCFATWCGPCKMIAPKVSAMSQEEKYKDSVDFYKIDVDEVPDVAQELGIRAMPTFLLFKDGEKVEEVVGANERAIRAAVDKYL